MKKLFWLFLGLTVIFAVSCTGKDSKAGKDVVEISFWHYFTDPDGPVFNKYIEQFNKENEGRIYVKAEFVPRDELMKQYAIGAVSGELPDIGQVDNPDHASYSAMGILEDITDLYNKWDEADFLDGPINSCKYNDRIYGLPQSSNCLALYYDIDMLAAANIPVPETWSQLLDACEKLSNPEKGIYGLAICAVGNEEGTFQFIPWLESAGSFDDLTSPGSVAALDFLGTLVKKGYMSKECINWNQGDVEKQFSAGQAAMMINGPWNIRAVETNAPSKKWGVAKVPRADNGKFASVLGGENFVICKGAKVEAAWEFLSWFCGKEVSEEYTKAIKKFSPRSDIDGTVQYADDPKMALFAEVMPTSLPRGPHPQWPQISAAIYTAEHEVFTGQKTAENAMKDAQAKIATLIK